MGAFKFDSDQDSGQARVEIDLGAIQGIAMTGVRRASAFLGFGLKLTRDAPPESVGFGDISRFNFLPDPLPTNVGAEIQSEFKVWLIANALRELDQYFSLFLDAVWDVLRMTSTQPLILGWDESPFDAKFRSVTNASRKAEKVCTELDCLVEAAALQSLSSARNALSHNLGVVRDRDVNSDGQMLVQWLAPQIALIENGEFKPFEDLPKPYAVTSEEGAQVVMKIILKSRSFAVGSRIELSEIDLSEICFFYYQVAGAISAKLHERTGANGPAQTGE